MRWRHEGKIVGGYESSSTCDGDDFGISQFHTIQFGPDDVLTFDALGCRSGSRRSLGDACDLVGDQCLRGGDAWSKNSGCREHSPKCSRVPWLVQLQGSPRAATGHDSRETLGKVPSNHRMQATTGGLGVSITRVGRAPAAPDAGR